MKFEFVAKHRGAWPVNLLCEALGVSRSGFYAWLVRPPSCRSQADEVLGAQVRSSFIASDRVYGARRVWHDVLALGQRCGLHRVERLMRAQALRARPKRRGLPKDAGQRGATGDNLLDRQFQADAPNRKWVADFTYIWTAEGWLYVAVVLDSLRAADGSERMVEDGSDYRIATNNFLRGGGDGYALLRAEARDGYEASEPLDEIVADAIEAARTVAPRLDGRLLRGE